MFDIEGQLKKLDKASQDTSKSINKLNETERLKLSYYRELIKNYHNNKWTTIKIRKDIF